MPLPILYSFRRCPYAMRARLALDVSGQACELREIALRDKPQEMLRASAKGTVPVLIDEYGAVLDQSLDIMLWALCRSDPEAWLTPDPGACPDLPRDDGHCPDGLLGAMRALIDHFDTEFKLHLDRYKYPDRFKAASVELSRAAASRSLLALEEKVRATRYLFGDEIALADVAIAPFVRQFANVDKGWFNHQGWSHLQGWLTTIIESPRFIRIMRPAAVWVPGTVGIRFPFPV